MTKGYTHENLKTIFPNNATLHSLSMLTVRLEANNCIVYLH